MATSRLLAISSGHAVPTWTGIILWPDAEGGSYEKRTSLALDHSNMALLETDNSLPGPPLASSRLALRDGEIKRDG